MWKPPPGPEDGPLPRRRVLPVVGPRPGSDATLDESGKEDEGRAGEGGVRPDAARIAEGWEHRFTAAGARADNELPDRPVRVRPEAVVAVVLASEGYPGEIRTGDQITGLAAAEDAGAEVFHAGTTMGEKGEVLTAGGRVLAVAARGATVADARGSAYQCSSLISFDGMQYRTDIGAGL